MVINLHFFYSRLIPVFTTAIDLQMWEYRLTVRLFYETVTIRLQYEIISGLPLNFKWQSIKGGTEMTSNS